MPKSSYLIAFPVLMLLCMAHSCQSRRGASWFAIREHTGKTVFHLNDSLHLEVTGKKGRIIDSLSWTIEGKTYGSKPRLSIYAGDLGLGTATVSSKVWHEGKAYESDEELVILSDSPPDQLEFELLRTLSHDTSAYTQGLFFTDGKLYESTGRKKESSLRINALNGRVLKSIPLPDDIFGEGACLLGDTLYQLSWRANKGFIYTKQLEKLGEFPYPGDFEGWGLCSDGRYLILSDGSNLIRFLDPQNEMKVVRTIEVFDHKDAIKYLNELEYVDGIIYANVYTENYIIGIDPQSGKVMQKIDLSGLLPRDAHYAGFIEHDYVLNGIAYDSSKRLFYVTGKKWPLLFEGKLKPSSD